MSKTSKPNTNKPPAAKIAQAAAKKPATKKPATKKPAAKKPAGKSALATRKAAVAELRAFGLRFPGAHTKSPWPGHLDLAVRDKTFAYLPTDDRPFSVSCKLPESCGAALMLPFVVPTAYGLGKSGWVSATLEDGAEIPIAMFKEWIEESYRAQAPRTLVRQLDAARTG